MRVRQMLDDGAIALEFLTHSTLAKMNTGASLDEILRTLEVPEHLLAKPYLRPKYDDPEFIVRGLWHLYAGWFDGNPAHLKPASGKDLGAEIVALTGGAEPLRARAEQLAQDGQTRRAAHRVEFPAAAQPGDQSIQRTLADVYACCAKAETSLIARAIYPIYRNEPESGLKY